MVDLKRAKKGEYAREGEEAKFKVHACLTCLCTFEPADLLCSVGGKISWRH